MWRILALSLVTGLPPPPPPQFAFLDAAHLAALCQAKGADSASARSLCLGYVVGSVDQVLAQQARDPFPSICPPGDLSANDALQAVLRHARVAAAANGVSAAGFVRLAMEQGFPCATNGAARGPATLAP